MNDKVKRYKFWGGRILQMAQNGPIKRTIEKKLFLRGQKNLRAGPRAPSSLVTPLNEM